MSLPAAHVCDPTPVGPVGAPCARVVRVMARSLDFYLALRCEVRIAADGWVLLSCGQTTFVLIQTSPSPPVPAPPPHQVAGSSLVRLTTPDVRALRRRLLAEGVPTSTITRPDHTQAGQIVVIDPDLHRVVIGQPERST